MLDGRPCRKYCQILIPNIDICLIGMTMISVYQSQRLFVMEYLATGALLFGIWVNNLSIMQQTKQRSLN